MILPEALREQLVHQHVRIVLVDLDLFQNHAALALDVRQAQDRVQHQVGQHIQGDGHMVGQRLDVEADGLLAGEGVQVAADRVHLAGNVLRGAGACALEEHVFHKVRDAVGLRRLAPRAGLDPYAHGHGTQMFHALGQDDQAVRQYGAAKVSLGGHRHPVNSIVGQCGLRGWAVFKDGRRHFERQFLSALGGHQSCKKGEMLYSDPSREKDLSQLVRIRHSSPGKRSKAICAGKRPSGQRFWTGYGGAGGADGASGEPAWRGRQLAEAIYRQRLAELSEITTLPNHCAAKSWLPKAGRWAVRQSRRSSSPSTARSAT
jgi:hypothetical protein